MWKVKRVLAFFISCSMELALAGFLPIARNALYSITRPFSIGRPAAYRINARAFRTYFSTVFLLFSSARRYASNISRDCNLIPGSIWLPSLGIYLIVHPYSGVLQNPYGAIKKASPACAAAGDAFFPYGQAARPPVFLLISRAVKRFKRK